MNGSPMNGPRAAADMRDVQAVRELVEREALTGALFRGEVRSFIARTEEELRAARADRGTMLRHLAALVEVPAEAPEPAPAERETLSPPTWRDRLGAWRTRLNTWLARPASTRAVLSLAAAGVLATLSGCVALMGVHP